MTHDSYEREGGEGGFIVHEPSPTQEHRGPAQPHTVADVLNAAADLLEKPGAWTRHAYARTEPGGKTCWPAESVAVCFCVLGAIMRTAPDEKACGGAISALSSRVGYSIRIWNDAKDRTQAEVVATLRQAATQSTGGAPCPVLLEALKKCRTSIAGFTASKGAADMLFNELQRIHAVASAAIAKAEGRS